MGTILQKRIESRQESHLKEDSIEYPVSINGEKRGMAEFPSDASRDVIMAAAEELAVVKN